MKKIGKTIYLLNPGTYIHCNDETIILETQDGQNLRFAFHTIAQIVIFYNTTLSSYLMKQCSDHNIVISYISAYGKYYGSFVGADSGNVLLRKRQFDMIDSDKAAEYVRMLLAAKIRNSVWTLLYFGHHSSNRDTVKITVDRLRGYINTVKDCETISDMRLIEAKAASEYFSAFDLLLKTEDVDMKFERRSRRPPLNNINALLSFFYTMMTNICCSALICAGLDAECGYLHTLRSGRNSLACDFVEEFRACIVDRFVISIVNRKEVMSDDFVSNSDGIKLTDNARKKLLGKWEEYLTATEITHRLYDKKMSLKVLPYEQAKLLAQYIRGDIDTYPPFLMT